MEYVDTSAYEAYEKQEGDYVEPAPDSLVESIADVEPDNSAKGAGE